MIGLLVLHVIRSRTQVGARSSDSMLRKLASQFMPPSWSVFLSYRAFLVPDVVAVRSLCIWRLLVIGSILSHLAISTQGGVARRGGVVIFEQMILQNGPAPF